MQDVRKLVPREPPDGFLTWVENHVDTLEAHGLIYTQEWVEDCGLEVLLDEWSGPRKRRMVRTKCSFCGHEELLHYGRGQKDYGFIPAETYSEVEGGSVAEDGDELICPNCGIKVKVRKKSSLRQKGYYVADETTAMSAQLVGEDSQEYSVSAGSVPAG